MFCSARNSDIEYLAIVLICPDIQSIMDHTLPSTTERRCNVARRVKISIGWLLKKASHVLIALNMQIAREIIKQTVILVYFGITISTGIGIIENNRNFFKSRVQVL